MHWTEPATADDSHAELEKKLWDAAIQLWSNAALKPSEYSPTVPGAFLSIRSNDLTVVSSRNGDSKVPTPYEDLQGLRRADGQSERAIEKENPDLADVLPKSYHILESRTLASLLKTMDKGGEPEPDWQRSLGLSFDQSRLLTQPPCILAT